MRFVQDRHSWCGNTPTPRKYAVRREAGQRAIGAQSVARDKGLHCPGDHSASRESRHVRRWPSGRGDVGRVIEDAGYGLTRAVGTFLIRVRRRSRTARTAVLSRAPKPFSSLVMSLDRHMAKTPNGTERTPETADRRLSARRPVPSLAYVELGENNGGIILNISGSGLAVVSAAPLLPDGSKQLRFRLPGSSDWFEEKGDIAWISESKKNAGILFVDLSEDARNQIMGWVSSETSPAEFPPEGARDGKKPWRQLEMPGILAPQSPPARPANSDLVTQVHVQVPLPTPNATPAVLGARTSAEAHTAVARRRGGMEHEPDVEAGDAPGELVARRRSWGMVALVVSLVAVFLAGWFTAGARSGIFGRFRKAKLEAVGTANAVESQPANSVASAPSPSVQNIPAQGDASEPLLPVLPILPSAAGDFPGRQAINPRAEAHGNEPAPASGNTSAVGSAVQIMRPQQRVLGPSSARTTTTELSPQAESATPERLGAAAQPRETSVAAPPNPNANQPDGARAGSAGEQESSLPLKPAEDPEAAKTSISVSFSLYPSIQAPAGAKPQVSRQGAPLKIGQLLSRVDPVYPEDAEKQQIEGTVKLHAIIGPDGTIQSIGQTTGPALLVASAENAVRRWLFTPSFVGGQPVPAEEDITITFQLLKKTATQK